MVRTSAVSALVIAACLAAGFTSAPALAQSPSGQASPQAFRSMVAERNEVTVVIKFILKGDGMGGDMEQEVLGTMIDPKGLVLVSNFIMGGMAARFGGGVVPSEIKVLVGDDTKGVEAKLIARDTEMDLAWVQINTPKETPYAHLDITQSVDAPQIGDHLYTVTRASKFFDRTPIGREMRVIGHAKKPRELYLYPADANSVGGLGMVVYNADNKCVGVTALILPSDEEMENAQDLFGDYPPIGILPIKDVAKATAQARETAATATPDSTEPAPADAPAEAPAEPATP